MTIPRPLFQAAQKTTLALLVTTVALTILFPLFFLFTFSLMSDYETYSEWPKPLWPHSQVRYRMEKISPQTTRLLIWNHGQSQWQPFGPEHIEANEEVAKKLSRFLTNYGNTTLSPSEILSHVQKAQNSGFHEFTAQKSLSQNYQRFFRLYSGAADAVLHSLSTALLTILISVVIGGMAGYAFARYVFKGKDVLKLSVLFVRMFPPVAIAIPMVVILGRMGLYDRPAGLSLIYSVNQIAMNIWITASIFMGIPESLEEAALIFGANKRGAFFRITLPLAVPGLAACAMYSFISSWNEVINALILTQFRPTFPVVVYKSLLGANAQVHLIAAGSIAQAAPAILFTLIIRRYLLQMWGGVKV
ncbi:MAG: carbohydrate ABC transporter permease [Spirochaetales bacterium]|nr:carbohydrate ABC transporter permease [Spirochaetales bacterium]